MKADSLAEKLYERGEKISKAQKIRTLMEKRKKLIGHRQSLTKFGEPVLFLIRENGLMEMYENATAGKFVFKHSNGNERYIELRPADQVTFSYGDNRVRSYIAHENRPHSGFGDPILDAETIMRGYERTKAADLKYQASLKRLDIQGKRVWLWFLAGIAGLIFIGGFVYNTYIVPSQLAKNRQAAQNVVVPGVSLFIGASKMLIHKYLHCNRKD